MKWHRCIGLIGCLLTAQIAAAVAKKPPVDNHMLARNTMTNHGANTPLLMWLALLAAAGVVVLAIALVLHGNRDPAEHKTKRT